MVLNRGRMFCGRLTHASTSHFFLDELVVLLNHIVQVLYASESAVLRHNPFLL